MDDNFFAPPQSSLEPPPEVIEGPRVPWEDPETYPGLLDRITETLKLLFHPQKAGEALGGNRNIWPAAKFMALVGLPLAWLSQGLVTVMSKGGVENPLSKLMNLPTPEPNPAQRVVQMVVLVFFPISLIVSFAILGLVIHGGLWLTRGLQKQRGIEVTFRTGLYFAAATYLVGWVFNLWLFLPAVLGISLMALSLIFWLAAFVYQGVLLAKAHATETWRGVLGVFVPAIFLLCCCGGIGILAAIAIPALLKR